MAVTKQTYTAAATWTASQLAGIFRSAFIDAGLMTDWFDSFVNTGIENRVLRVINNGAKAYGTVYYWFMFTTAGAYISTTTQWNAASDIPGGTQYLDYFSTATNVVTNHQLFFSATATTTTTLTRYTSAVNTNCSWFVARNSGSTISFLIPYGTYNATGFVDQDKCAFNGVIYPSTSTTNNQTFLTFNHLAGHTRRTFLRSTALRGSTTLAHYTQQEQMLAYMVLGNANNTANNFNSTSNCIRLPTAHANTNTGLAVDHTPVFTSVLCSPYLPAMPSDLGIAPYYASNSFTLQDTLVVSAGTEEWEILFAGNNGVVADAGRIMLLARVVG